LRGLPASSWGKTTSVAPTFICASHVQAKVLSLADPSQKRDLWTFRTQVCPSRKASDGAHSALACSHPVLLVWVCQFAICHGNYSSSPCRLASAASLWALCGEIRL
jgi:hypothetical protein